MWPIHLTEELRSLLRTTCCLKRSGCKKHDVLLTSSCLLRTLVEFKTPAKPPLETDQPVVRIFRDASENHAHVEYRKIHNGLAADIGNSAEPSSLRRSRFGRGRIFAGSCFGNTAPCDCEIRLHRPTVTNSITKTREQHPPYYRISNPEGFPNRTGLVYSIGASGALRTSRFWTVAGPDVFEDFVEFLVDARGEGAVIEGDEFRRKIWVKPSKPEPRKPHISWSNLYVMYDDGIIYLGSTSDVLRLTTGQILHATIKQAKTKDWYLWASTQDIPTATSNDFMTAVGMQSKVQLQRRDAEEDADFKARYALYSSHIEALRTTLFDIDEVVAWTNFPDDGEPFEAHLKINAKANSPLLTPLKKLPSLSTLTPTPSPDSIGKAVAYFHIQTEFRALCEWYLMQLSGNQEPLTSVLRSVINKGKIALTASVGVDGESTVASGSMEVPDDLNLKMLADQLELDFNSENGFNIVRSNADLFKFFNFAYLKQLEDTLRFCFSNQFSATEANEPAKPAESTMPSQSLVSIHLDFEKIINWPNPVLASQFIEDPERSYQRARELSRNRPGREDASESSS